jgi:hypothetical protein
MDLASSERRLISRVGVVAKSACFLCHVRPSACIGAALTGRISVKFDTGDLETSRFG